MDLRITFLLAFSPTFWWSRKEDCSFPTIKNWIAHFKIKLWFCCKFVNLKVNFQMINLNSYWALDSNSKPDHIRVGPVSTFHYVKLSRNQFWRFRVKNITLSNQINCIYDLVMYNFVFKSPINWWLRMDISDEIL